MIRKVHGKHIYKQNYKILLFSLKINKKRVNMQNIYKPGSRFFKQRVINHKNNNKNIKATAIQYIDINNKENIK